ncbi:hypothetical protein [Colwellia psychrerythraea]|uniref:Uncharacterized protein n=1 Tax=Colwellia psychrerythraea TaxID=28229 RepID=A0A099K9X2_COLPS|nr:hypothetical protein [Colwellia psychrerythraea]KGJ86423.1 hypothetical protein ND2E_0989 [Colwellia psychrerythraea]
MKKELTEAEKARVREQARLRKQKQRAKKAELTVQAFEVSASATEQQQLNDQALIRGFDSISEYLMTLMRIDGDRIKHDQAAIGTCTSCNLPLPNGCNAVFKGQFDCSYIHGLPLVSMAASVRDNIEGEN